MKNEVLHLDQVDLAYPGQTELVMKGLNLSVRKGERIVLLGENGVGKTMLLKALAGLIQPKNGSILLNQKEIKKWTLRDLAEQVAFVGNRTAYNQLLSVKEFIAFGRYPFVNWMGKLNDEDIALIEDLGETCGIDHLYDQAISEVSDGEKQKIVIARALAQQTGLLLLDEPSSHLDIKNALTILKLIKSQSELHQKTVLFSSHHIEVALNIADTVWLCHNREVIVCSIDEFKANKELQQMLFGDLFQFESSTGSFKIKF